MQCWFRFRQAIALAAFATFAVATDSALAEPPASAPPASATASRKLKGGSLLEGLQSAIEEQGKIIAAQTEKLDAQSRQMEQLGTQITAQGKQIELLTGQLTQAIALLSKLDRPVTAPAAPAPQARPEIATAVAADSGIEVTEPREVKAKPVPALDDNPDATTHVIKKGDNLITIARHANTTVAELMKLNKIENERKLQIGQVILLPKSAEPAGAPSATPTVP
jgi:LysM repeat protein